MRKQAIALMLLGILLTLTAAIGTYRYTHALEAELARLRSNLAALGAGLSIPVLNADQPRGAQLTAADFTYIQLPESLLPQNILRELPELQAAQNHLALRDLKQGALLHAAALAKPGYAADAPLVPTLGRHAFAVNAHNIAQVGDLLQVGTLIDLVWTRDIGGSRESRLIASGLTVILPPSGVKGQPGHVMLEGLTEDAIKRIAAEQTGQFDILLSGGRLDPSSGKFVIGPSQLKLLPLVTGMARDDAPPHLKTPLIGAPVPRDSQCNTAVIRGGQRSTVELPC